MSRRETMIIAVLINAGLLVVLFTSALKSHREVADIAAEPMPIVAPVTEIPMRQEVAAVQGDEVDQVLKQFANASQPAAMPSQEQSAPNFAQDLTAIAFPTTPPAAVETAPVAPPVALEVPQVAAAEGTKSYSEVRVKKGDFLEKIARNNHSSVEEIMRANQLTSTRLKIGQVLRIPSKSAKKTSAPSAVNVAAQGNDAAKFYTVKNGDNPWTIAVKNHLKVEELLKLNGLDEEKARRLKPGDQIRIR